MLTRRELLGVPVVLGAAAWLAGCSDEPEPAVDPQLAADHTALTDALASETALLAQAEQEDDVAAQTVLAAHVALLRDALGITTDPADPSPSGSPATSAIGPPQVAALTARLRRAGRSHLAALADVTGPVARLLASVAASDLALSASQRGAGR